MSENFSQRSYARHQDHEDLLVAEVPSIINHPDSIDAWHHKRMHDLVSPLHHFFGDAEWLTIGDTGADAYYLKSKGIRKLISSCISTKRLYSLQKKGLLENIKIKEINAEDINMPDDSVDVIFCKEAYHHFPRPPLAFYEFFRVCRRAVIYLEPAEKTGWKILDALKDVVKFILRSQSKSQQLFEPSGNFLFRLSENEFKKMATSLQIEYLAVKYSNDFYERRIAKKNTSERFFMFVEKLGLAVQNILCYLRLMNYGLIVLVLFKDKVPEEMASALRSKGFKVIRLPRNPYLVG